MSCEGSSWLLRASLLLCMSGAAMAVAMLLSLSMRAVKDVVS